MCVCIYICICLYICFSGGTSGKKNKPKNLLANEGDLRDPEEGMATHSSILPWRIPWTEEPGGLHP